MRYFLSSFSLMLVLICACSARGQHELTYLDEFCDPYYPGTGFPKLTTPQWIGEEGVEAVVTFGIDDMRDPAKYEAFLRPILNRLKEIDGRAAVSIMTCSVDPKHPQLQAWLKEGVSIETHTVDHPCPCLQGGDFDKAKSTYDRCVDLVFSIPGNQPVAFRFPCMDSRNTPSPRAYAEIINQTTPNHNFLQASTSVVCLFTPSDKRLPKKLTLDANGKPRFRRYIPFPSFVNIIENYPYPYPIGKLCWEFPCTIPDDWQGQNIQQPNNPQTVDDMMAAIDATVIKKGIANIIFHPHGWIRSEQLVDVVDRVQKKYGKRVKFLTFKECVSRINEHLLLGQPLRAKNGGDNGVRIVDLNRDGYLDVLIGNEHKKVVRIWRPTEESWRDIDSPIQVTAANDRGERIDLGVKLGVLNRAGQVNALVSNDREQSIYAFQDGRIERQPLPKELAAVHTSVRGVDQGVRLRDLNRDGVSEVIVANKKHRRVFSLSKTSAWHSMDAAMPAAIVDELGRDNGLRFVDIDKDGFDDVIVANEQQTAVYLYEQKTNGFTKQVAGLKDVPLIAQNGKNNGAWFADDHLWLQNENTNRLPDGVDRRSFTQLLGTTDPNPQLPKESLNSIRVRPGFQVELMAAEPLVMDPIALDWGADGKLWVVEMADYPLGLDDEGKPGGRVRYLEDTNGDGKYDKSTLFLDEIAYPTGVMAWRDGVLVSAAPALFFAKDSNGDGKADVREDLYRGFGEGNQQHRVNGFEWGLDNWVYLANGDSGGTIESIKSGKKVDIRGRDLRIRPDDGSLDAQTGQTQFGRHRDDHGNWFGCSNPTPVRHFALADHYLRRNPLVAPVSSRRDIARGDNSQVFPISRVLSHWSGYKPPAPGQPHKFTSACSTSVYRDNLFGPAFKQNTFTCEPVHNAVHRRVLIPQGISFESRRPTDEPDFEFLASTDSWFRPATVTTGPDGALWIVDMYRLVIEHPQWIDDQREKELFLRAGHDRGRIYRVYPADRSPRPIARLADASTKQLVAALDSPNGRQRDLAQRLLIQRGDASAVDDLQRMAGASTNPLARLHALCTLDGLESATQSVLLKLLGDDHPSVRRHAVRIAEQRLAKLDGDGQLLSALCELADAAEPQVKLQLAYSLGYSTDPRAAQALAKVAADAMEDPLVRAAVFSSLNEQNLPHFHAAIAKNAVAAEAFRKPIFDLAHRMNDTSITSHMLASLLNDADLVNDHVKRFKSLTGMLAAVKKGKPKLDQETATRLGRLTATAGSMARDDETAIAIRVAAIEFLAVSPSDSAHEGVDALMGLVDFQQPIEIQRAAVNALGTHGSDSVFRRMLGRFPALSPMVRSAILDEALSRERSVLVLIDALKNGEVALQAIGALGRQRLLAHNNRKIKAQAEALFGRSTSGDKLALVKKYQIEMPTKRDVAAGHKLFSKRCAACHRINGVGHVVGPDLTALKNRSAKAMLTAVLDPNQAVEDKYQSYNVVTVDGRTQVGIITDESTNSITLRMQEGKSRVILREDIELIRGSGKSLMPEGQEKEISPTDMGHLIAYLEKLAPSAKKFVGNNPEIVKPAADGTLELSAASCRIHGPSLVFESKYKNLGYWKSLDDRAEWSMAVSKLGKYDVWLDYACDNNTAGNTFALTIEDRVIRGRVDGTGTWNDYKQVKIGTVQLEANKAYASFAATGKLNNCLIDLRAITLKPAE